MDDVVRARTIDQPAGLAWRCCRHAARVQTGPRHCTMTVIGSPAKRQRQQAESTAMLWPLCLNFQPRYVQPRGLRPVLTPRSCTRHIVDVLGADHKATRYAWVAVALWSVMLTVACTSSGGGIDESPGPSTPAASVSATPSAIPSWDPEGTPGTCSDLVYSAPVRTMANSLGALVTGTATADDHQAIAGAIAAIRDVATRAPADLSGPLTTTADAVDRLNSDVGPTQEALDNLTAAFAALDARVQSTCHFPLQ